MSILLVDFCDPAASTGGRHYPIIPTRLMPLEEQEKDRGLQ